MSGVRVSVGHDEDLVVHHGVIAERQVPGRLDKAGLGPVLDPSHVLVEEDHQDDRHLKQVLGGGADPIQSRREGPSRMFRRSTSFGGIGKVTVENRMQE
jgi:hypothetical protein